jgi:hypothetical protein
MGETYQGEERLQGCILCNLVSTQGLKKAYTQQGKL